MFFNLNLCPTGWTEFIAGRGRYLVGLNSGGTLGGNVGVSLSDQENRATGKHNHGISDPGHIHSINRQWGSSSAYNFAIKQAGSTADKSTQSATTGITINDAGPELGTNAPYTQLLICQKD